MKKKSFILCFLILLFSTSFVHAKFPVHLGGFTLGEDIKSYHHLIHLDTSRQAPYNHYLKESELISQPGFKSGQIAYGVCDTPNKVVRIKLKFADSSKKFFNRLMKRYRNQLGEPDEYRGDPFQTFIAWKWSFTNDQNERISLILQHNVLDEDEKIGTAVKLTLTSQVERERTCFMTKSSEKENQQPQPALSQKELWDLFVPF